MNTLKEHLERLIDAHTLPAVLERIALVCALKAEHVEHTWQDARLARCWGRASTLLDKATASAVKLGL